jgi:hypothetical protein
MHSLRRRGQRGHQPHPQHRLPTGSRKHRHHAPPPPVVLHHWHSPHPFLLLPLLHALALALILLPFTLPLFAGSYGTFGNSEAPLQPDSSVLRRAKRVVAFGPVRPEQLVGADAGETEWKNPYGCPSMRSACVKRSLPWFLIFLKP